ncbi:MAG: hypothetical protein IJZ36_04235 [Bacilli bacterium]|nr:hypothetical protein [Bacilli bacterium]
MAKKQIDKYYSILGSVQDKLKANRLIAYLYLYQMAGFNINFKYKVTGAGMKSTDATTYLNNLISKGLITVKRGMLYLCDSENTLETKYNISEEDNEIFEKIKVLADKLDYDVLYFVCITNLVLTDMLDKFGADFLENDLYKNKLKQIISNLCFEYTDNNLDRTLKLIEDIKTHNFDNTSFRNFKIERVVDEKFSDKVVYKGTTLEETEV